MPDGGSRVRVLTTAAVVVIACVGALVFGIRTQTTGSTGVELGLARHGVTTLDQLARRIDECAEPRTDRSASGSAMSDVAECALVAYVTSPSMPLSTDGIPEIEAATRELGVDVFVLDAEQLYTMAHPLAAGMVARGATVHFPSVSVFRDGAQLGGAIAGYKKAAAYRALIGSRLAAAEDESPGTGAATYRAESAASALDVDPAAATDAADRIRQGRAASAVVPVPTGASHQDSIRDIRVDGQPGPYFRFVPGRNAIAYESGRVIYLLDLRDGSTSVGPGSIDFVPSPDGSLFVTPERNALEFYSADAVFRAATRGAGRDVRPIFVDREMRDQYPSVGILQRRNDDGDRVVRYRVLTSWYDRVAFRDYDVTYAAADSAISVVPVGAPIHACPNRSVSLPIMSQSGHELAARDEASASTKIFALADDGSCGELVDLGLQSGKVAWHADGQRIAFAIPNGVVRDGAGVVWDGRDQAGDMAGIFVFDRSDRTLTPVPGSEDVNRLAFPEFVADSAVVFLLARAGRDRASRFRVSCCQR